jgi:hypothetical protein
MSDTSADDPRYDGGWYQIRVKGHLGPRWATWFEGMTLTTHSDGTTVLAGPVADQAALHGLLHKVGDVGLPLLSVTQVHAALSTCPPTNPDNSRTGD